MMDASLLAAMVLGLALGLKHALDADHVVAVSTIASKSKNILVGSSIGLLWGAGHTLTLFLVGLPVLFFRLTIPDKLALSMEFLVGVVLVILGVSVLREFVERSLHPHRHEDRSHTHFHSHQALEHGHTHKALLVGMVHGLAGSAALMLLVLTTISSPWAGLAYIIIFGLGSIMGMLTISTLIGLPFVLTAGHLGAINQGVRATAGVVSIVLGFLIMGEIALVGGLFL